MFSIPEENKKIVIFFREIVEYKNWLQKGFGPKVVAKKEKKDSLSRLSSTVWHFPATDIANLNKSYGLQMNPVTLHQF